MKIRISEKMISLPPHLSTSWENIQTLHLDHEKQALVFDLKDGSQISVPGLEQKIIDLVFDIHSKVLEQSRSGEKKGGEKALELRLAEALTRLRQEAGDFEVEGDAFPIQFDISGGGLQPFGAMEHNPDMAHMPDLPQELLRKIAVVARVLGKEESLQTPEYEPHCNCFYCQVARAISSGVEEEEEESFEEEEVSDEELHFRTWDIEKVGQDLYSVANPLESKEKYSVYLGSPVGCTCGEKNCEHLQAVLNSYV